MTRPKRKTVSHRAIDAWYRRKDSLLAGATTTVARVGAIHSFMAGYLAGWSAAKGERK